MVASSLDWKAMGTVPKPSSHLLATPSVGRSPLTCNLRLGVHLGSSSKSSYEE